MYRTMIFHDISVPFHPKNQKIHYRILLPTDIRFSLYSRTTPHVLITRPLPVPEKISLLRSQTTPHVLIIPANRMPAPCIVFLSGEALFTKVGGSAVFPGLVQITAKKVRELIWAVCVWGGGIFGCPQTKTPCVCGGIF